MARKRKSGTKSPPEPLVIHPDAAGIDIGATEIFVAVPAGRDEAPVRSFPTFTQDLNSLADWLGRCGIKTVAMESTGVYWIPLFQILETRGVEVCLVTSCVLPAGAADLCRADLVEASRGIGADGVRPYPTHAEGTRSDESSDPSRLERHYGRDRAGHYRGDPGW